LSELVFVDTSVWVEALRRRPEATTVELSALLDEDRVALAAPVRIEILSGASRRSFRRLHEDLLALPAFYPGPSTWTRVEQWVEAAVEEGECFGVGDLLIAAIASENGGRLWSRDDDFTRMSRLGFVQLFPAAPPSV
jgi:predicted nucleic acid-binding protein